MNNWAVVIGNPIDGITVYGPFETLEDACSWGETITSSDGDWWPTSLVDPTKEIM
jgi:hypothetical protein